jgi:2-polyprenyl-6-hydroxyphenyl methylase/3-demethylubiquinone-9 3-methyltransferase
MESKAAAPAFTFGQNWLRYSRDLDSSRIAEAEQSVQSLLNRSSLSGLTFLDIGAGSGLFSIAAVRLGATRVVAFDRDVDCTRAITENAGRFLSADDRPRLTVRRGDVLEPASLPDERFDVVYAWGSLHHTGSMWEAIGNASDRCAPGGLFALAIYNDTWTSPGWLRIKRLYHRAPAWSRSTMVAALVGVRLAVRAVRLKGSRTERGMTVWYDAVDWLGGLPYEYASREAIARFLGERGFALERCVPTRRSGCNEFVFVRRQDA